MDSAIFFPVIFFCFILIVPMRLSTQQKNGLLWLIFILNLGSFMSARFIVFRKSTSPAEIDDGTSGRVELKGEFDKKKLDLCIKVIFAVALCAMLYEYYQNGGISLFYSKIELTRFTASKSGYVHIFAVQSKLVMILIAAYLFSKKSIVFREDKLFIHFAVNYSTEKDYIKDMVKNLAF